MKKRRIRNTKQLDRFGLNHLQQKITDSDPNNLGEVMDTNTRTYRRLKKKLIKKGRRT
mgnify:FL=1|jgi:hypothetical protein